MKAKFFILALLLPVLSFAQFTITPSGGLSVPVGKYSKLDIDDEETWAAKPGIAPALELAYQLNQFIGFGLMGSYVSHSLDKTAYINALKKQTSLDFGGYADNYVAYYGLFGLKVGYFSDQFEVSLMPAVGYGYSDFQTTALTSYGPPPVVNVDVTNYDASGIFYGLSSSFKTYINGFFGVGLNIAYVQADLEKDGLSLVSALGPGGNEVRRDFFTIGFKPQMLNVNLALTFRIR